MAGTGYSLPCTQPGPPHGSLCYPAPKAETEAKREATAGSLELASLWGGAPSSQGAGTEAACLHGATWGLQEALGLGIHRLRWSPSGRSWPCPCSGLLGAPEPTCLCELQGLSPREASFHLETQTTHVTLGTLPPRNCSELHRSPRDTPGSGPWRGRWAGATAVPASAGKNWAPAAPAESHPVCRGPVLGGPTSTPWGGRVLRGALERGLRFAAPRGSPAAQKGVPEMGWGTLHPNRC